MIASISRRRVIGITAAAAGLSLLPLGGNAHAGGQLVEWRGHAMGAVATLQIHHHDPAAAERLIARARTEVQRLERIFSLYNEDSALVMLNRQGMLIAPPADLVSLLTECRQYWELTDGAFDPTMQAFWTLYRDHFSANPDDETGPSAAALQQALDRVGFAHVLFDADRVVLARRGMALSLNGIAQGFMTDRIIAMLRSEGVDQSLVDMGEPRVLGSRPDGSPWRVGIADPDQPDRIVRTVEIVGRAVSTSGGYGFRFDREGRFHHLIDPQTGRPADRYRSMTVVLPTASAADALSTAFSMMGWEDIERAHQALGSGFVHAIMSSRQAKSIGA